MAHRRRITRRSGGGPPKPAGQTAGPNRDLSIGGDAVIFAVRGVVLVTWDPTCMAVHVEWQSWANPTEFASASRRRRARSKRASRQPVARRLPQREGDSKVRSRVDGSRVVPAGPCFRAQTHGSRHPPVRADLHERARFRAASLKLCTSPRSPKRRIVSRGLPPAPRSRWKRSPPHRWDELARRLQQLCGSDLNCGACDQAW